MVVQISLFLSLSLFLYLSPNWGKVEIAMMMEQWHNEEFTCLKDGRETVGDESAKPSTSTANEKINKSFCK